MRVMKSLLGTLFLLLLSITSALADSSSLYTRDKFVPRDISEMKGILEDFQERSPSKNIIFYVHGRKKNVEVEWKNLSLLEDTYNVKIVMFHWPSWSSMVERPVKAAEDAAEELGEALREINDYKSSHLEEFSKKKLVFLSHSMGNVVVRYYALNHYKEGDFIDHGRALFDNYISTSADVPMLEHKKWLSKIRFASRRYVTFNNMDIVLRSSYILDILNADIFSYKLGLGFQTFSWRSFFMGNILDKGSSYIDFSKVIKNEHRYFQKDDPLLNTIFKPLFNGLSFDFKTPGLNITEKGGVHYVND